MERPRWYEMFKTLKNAWKVPDIRKKILFTLLILILLRLGASIPVPFVSSEVTSSFNSQYGGTVLGFMSVLSGGALAQATLFALSVNPYITAQIVMQLLTIAIPPLEKMSKDEKGRKKIEEITRYVSIALSAITAFGYTSLLESNGWLKYDAKVTPQWFVYLVIIFCFCAGASIIMWLCEQVDNKGIGNGVSMVLFANIISRLPSMGVTLLGWAFPAFVSKFIYQQSNSTLKNFDGAGFAWALVYFVCIVGLVVLSVWFTNSERRIPIQYAKRVVGRKMYGGQGTNLPIKMNMTGVMPIIFASSIISVPATIYAMFEKRAGWSTDHGFGLVIDKFFESDTWTYIVLYLVLLVAFSYFYTLITFNPVEVSNNIRSNGGAIPGIRQGKPTSDFIKKILDRVTLIGAGFLGIVACLPMFVSIFTSDMGNLAFGGSSLLIVVGVALETIRTLEAQLSMRNYKGFLG